MNSLRTKNKHSALDLVRSGASVSILRGHLYAQFGADTPPERLIVVGAADEGRRLVECCKGNGIQVEMICDDSPERVGESIEGLIVKPTSALDQIDKSTYVVIASHRTTGAARRLKDMGFTRVFPFMVMQVLFPEVFSPHMFYDGLLESIVSSRYKILSLLSLFQDERSVEVLDRALGYRIFGDPLIFEDQLDDGLYGDESAIAFGSKEVYIDCGAFNGDSIQWFRGNTNGNFERIIAFEPDPETYEILFQNFCDDARIECVNLGVYSEKTILNFSAGGSRGSSFVSDGCGIEVPVTSLDSFLNGSRVTYIKMNIEGAEIAALWGAKKSLARWGPKLAVSTYHRPHDIWEVVELVSRLLPDHRYYLRQHDGGIIETVLYAVPRD